MQQKVQFCKTSDGVQIAYAVHGGGFPIVFVPGWVSHLELQLESPGWVDAIEDLSRDFMLVRYDKRGTGLSDRNVSDFSLEPRLRDLEAVVERLGFPRYAMHGVSEGGPVAIAHAARHPDRVSHLVLQGTYAHLGRTKTTDAVVSLIEAEWAWAPRRWQTSSFRTHPRRCRSSSRATSAKRRRARTPPRCYARTSTPMCATSSTR